jgi:NAD(P)H-dependent flavin oxidoreductase YrpB (nitropropane dioxygenase family)
MINEGRAMRKEGDLKWSQVVLAANTPMLLRAGLVEGRLDAGVLSSGQASGVIDDLPTVAELIARIMNEAEATLKQLRSYE